MYSNCNFDIRYQRARPIIIDPALYHSRVSSVYYAKEKRSLPSSIKLFTGMIFCILSPFFFFLFTVYNVCLYMHKLLLASYYILNFVIHVASSLLLSMPTIMSYMFLYVIYRFVYVIYVSWVNHHFSL